MLLAYQNFRCCSPGRRVRDTRPVWRKTVGLSTNRHSRVDMLKDARHAASKFSRQPELQADIVIWFRSNLPPGGYGLPPAIR